VIVGCGVTIPKGSLPVFSCDTIAEAESLITLTCSTNLNGEYIAPELAREQTLENLSAFSDRLQKAHDMIRQRAKNLEARPITGSMED